MVFITGVTSIRTVLIALTLMGSLLLILISYWNVKVEQELTSTTNRLFFSTNKYWINTPKCKIPFVNPWIEEVAKFYHPRDYIQCSEKGLLTYVEKEGSLTTLRINQSLLPQYSFLEIGCCYSTIKRYTKSKKPDNIILTSSCTPFKDGTVVTAPIIKVQCRDLFKEVYSNVHAIVALTEPKPKTRDLPNAATTFSVLFVGIDSVSKSNLVRTMPHTFAFLEKHDFVNLKGFTKIGLNTMPSWLATFGGYTRNQSSLFCDVAQNADQCPLIWTRFANQGYLTALAEDATNIGTFNYLKKGFVNEPTTFYFRPYVLATEKLSKVERENMLSCTGPENPAERIMNLAKDFQKTLKDYPKFSLFWMNSFSHDSLNMPSAMDLKVEEFLKEMLELVEDTIFFFISDHGFRFGEIRNTQAGWLEDRTPFFYIHLPDRFKRLYPKETRNLQINSGRLTNPFDVYMTLQHVLFLANSNFTVEQSLACPKCHSLFTEISDERTCEDAAIEQEWCVCNAKTVISSREKWVQEAAAVLVGRINQMIDSNSQGKKCQRYELKEVMYSGVSELGASEKNRTRLLLRVVTKPEAKFESSVELLENGLSRVDGEISRLDRYAEVAYCVKDHNLERLCFCKDKGV